MNDFATAGDNPQRDAGKVFGANQCIKNILVSLLVKGTIIYRQGLYVNIIWPGQRILPGLEKCLMLARDANDRGVESVGQFAANGEAPSLRSAASALVDHANGFLSNGN